MRKRRRIQRFIKERDKYLKMLKHWMFHARITPVGNTVAFQSCINGVYVNTYNLVRCIKILTEKDIEYLCSHTNNN